MNRVTAIVAALLVGAALLAPATASAKAATGRVLVFELEYVPLTVWENPKGCKKLPLAAHVLVNQTDTPVEIYADPFCLSPSLDVNPGFGSHVVPGSGSFQTEE
ncbi:hypothetical protein GCM10010174_55580 [Kutzneria viridogrisea]|uniref:Secreted protein n=2 Tax=Kutzneria TaxID=43356 RepID=A0ABR6BKP5_9PSEU|nr:hypothetical protein [Kutzneria albida]AHH95177.1 putative secreted protein [Kutzneria albida DSM 43870]MBA8927466.1 hypothetical protein [Kutzneria viridogrisea]